MLLTVSAIAGGNISAAPVPIEEPKIKNFYVGAGVAFNEITLQERADKFIKPDLTESGFGIQADLGYSVCGANGWFLNVEGRLGVANTDIIDSTWYAAYLKPVYMFSGEGRFKEGFGIYGLLGYGAIDLSYSTVGPYGGTITYAKTVDDFTYGAGILYGFSETIEVFADYVVLPELANLPENIDEDVLVVGVNYRF